jgi:hypothetical protein
MSVTLEERIDTMRARSPVAHPSEFLIYKSATKLVQATLAKLSENQAFQDVFGTGEPLVTDGYNPDGVATRTLSIETKGPVSVYVRDMDKDFTTRIFAFQLSNDGTALVSQLTVTTDSGERASPPPGVGQKALLELLADTEAKIELFCAEAVESFARNLSAVGSPRR